MTAIIGAGVFSIVIILSFLIICGLPLGELTMGGQYKVFSKETKDYFGDAAYFTDVFCNNNFASRRIYTIMVFR